MAQLKTKNVFLDTQVFFDSGFRYQGQVLSALASYATEGDVCVFLTDITVEEVKANIRDAVQEAVQAHQSFSAKGKILHNSSSVAVKTTLTALNKSALVTELIAQFEAYLEEVEATILKAYDMKVGPILDAYFSQKPPFGLGKKKSEFPDALALEALRDWCGKTSNALYVISGDADMQAACSETGPLHSLPRLADFLDALTSEETVTEFVRTETAKRKDEIVKRVTQVFPDRGFIITDVADFHAHVNEVRVDDVGLDDTDFEVIEVSTDSATIVATAHISYEADLMYGNENTASYDHEDGYFFFDTVNKTVELEEDYDAQIIAKFKDHDPASFTLSDVQLDAPDTITIKANEDEGWPYK
ncbi:MAG TPA: PIN domain-containing protein [Terriglobia bacterium]|nr:PIN domain-containing protein [Terriglobia bacterium]